MNHLVNKLLSQVFSRKQVDVKPIQEPLTNEERLTQYRIKQSILSLHGRSEFAVEIFE